MTFLFLRHIGLIIVPKLSPVILFWIIWYIVYRCSIVFLLGHSCHCSQYPHTFSNLLFSFLRAGEAGNDNHHNNAMMYYAYCMFYACNTVLETIKSISNFRTLMHIHSFYKWGGWSSWNISNLLGELQLLVS